MSDKESYIVPYIFMKIKNTSEKTYLRIANLSSYISY